jgi:hypothetical protein
MKQIFLRLAIIAAACAVTLALALTTTGNPSLPEGTHTFRVLPAQPLPGGYPLENGITTHQHWTDHIFLQQVDVPNGPIFDLASNGEGLQVDKDYNFRTQGDQLRDNGYSLRLYKPHSLSSYFRQGGLGTVLFPLFGIEVIAFLTLLYLLPIQVAKFRSHNNYRSILVCTAFLGWTFLGWVGCLAWAMSDNVSSSVAVTQS